MMRFGGWVAGAALALGMATPAAAEWREARAKHFVIYANTGEDDIRRMATRLEQLDGAMRRMHAVAEQPGQTSNPVTVYTVASANEVQSLCGKCPNIAGFYQPRASGSIAFTPRRGSSEGSIDPQIVLFHEYAHHFLLGNASTAYPAWYSEGYAEFVSTATFDKEALRVGVAAMHRAYSLLRTDMNIETLFDSARRKLSVEQQAAVYARGWLLTHYLMFSKERENQLGTYLRQLNEGVPSLKAGEAAFGGLKALDKDLDRYLNSSRITNVILPYTMLPVPPIAVRTLSEGEQAMIGLRMRSERGVNRETGREVYDRALRTVGPYADNPVVQGWLAEMAYDAGEDAAAEAAADRALAKDPKSVQALTYKAMVLMRRAGNSRDPARWAEARRWIVKANRLDPDAAEPLSLYYRSYRMAGAKPTNAAVQGLYRAFELVPQDQGLRFMVAAQAIELGDVKGARATLRPLAFDPHAPADNPAAQLLALLDSDKVQEALARIRGNAEQAAPGGEAP